MEVLTSLLQEVNWFNKFKKYQEETTDDKFNMFSICGVNHYENTHSSILAEILNPEGSHKLNNQFLKSFIQTLIDEGIFPSDLSFSLNSLQIFREYPIGSGRIDIVIINQKNQAILIENKIYAKDQFEQLKRYSEFGKNKFGKNFRLLYLTLWGDESLDAEKSNIKYDVISYQYIITNWLEKCIAISVRKPVVRETLIQYLNHIKNLTNSGSESIMNKELLDILTSEKYVESVFSILENSNPIKNHIINNIFTPQLEEICNELGLQLIDQGRNVDYVGSRYSGFTLVKSEWKNYRLFIEFQNYNLRNLVIGIGLIDLAVSDKSAHDEIKKCTSFKYQNKRNIFDNYPNYPNWNGEAMEAIVSGEMKKILKNKIATLLEIISEIKSI